jgi:hypothetical protein
MWQNLRAYQILANNPCPHINAEPLLVSTQYSFRRNSQTKCFQTLVDMDDFSSFWYMELVRNVCPHISVAFSTEYSYADWLRSCT